METVKLHPSIKTISEGAFYGCSALQMLEIPAEVTTISNEAFYNSGLISVTIPEKMTHISYGAFKGCSSLKSVVFPENLKEIGDYAFAKCDSLAMIEIPEGISLLPRYVFSDCKSLNTINLPSTLTTVEDYAFSNCDAITKVDFLPEGINSLGDGCFSHCDALTNVKLPSALTSIGRSVFYGCKSLVKVDFLPNGVTSLGSTCFAGCSGLVQVVLPEGLISLGSACFRDCPALTTMNLPTTIQSIGSSAFQNCYLLELDAKLPENLSYIGDRAFIELRSQKEFIFPPSLKYLPESVCEGCSSLEKVTLSEGLTSIYPGAFRNASKLSDIKLPSTLTSIYSYAFENTAITGIDFLPEGLKRIDSYAFKGCNIGKVLRFPSTLTSLADNALQGHSSIVTAIYLPATSGEVSVGNIFGITPSKGIETSNCLIYTEGIVNADITLPNIIYNNTCLALVLSEGTPFHCPEAFTASKVTFKKQFNQGDEYYENGAYTHKLYSQKGKASHWYGLSLPFTVTEITTSDGRTFAPFNSDVEGANPFWLRKPTSSGFENVTRIEAGEPYIIAFPCNKSYNDIYNVWGDVTFTGKGVTIPVTEEHQVNGEYYLMKRNYELKEKSSSMYLLNSPRWGYYGSSSSYYDTVNPDGKRGNSNYGWGSCFVPSLRQSWAFEAYLTAGISASSFLVSPEVSSRSTRALSSVPQIDDM